MTRVPKKPSGQQTGAIIGKVFRGAGGIVQMIEFTEYTPNAGAPTAVVNKVAGIYRLTPTLIKCTFALGTPTAAGVIRTIEAANLIWDMNDWLEAGDSFRWAIAEFTKGTFQNAVPDDGGGRRPRTQ